jgi:hypothetical protein
MLMVLRTPTSKIFASSEIFKDDFGFAERQDNDEDYTVWKKQRN